MKTKFTTIALALLLGCAGWANAATPDFSQVGFSTVNGATTGGAGGEVVTPANLAELKKYAEDSITPYIILIDKEINTGIACTIDANGHIAASGTSTTYGDVIHLGSNKTLLGVNCNAFLNRVGLNVQCHSNIIVRNIKFTMTGVPIDKNGENKIIGFANGAEVMLGDPDCFSIQADKESLAEDKRISDHIWIDHCEFYNEDPSVMTDYDRYDGLVDTKNNSLYITISWCYFHDHHKSCLIGKGGSDAFNHKTTFIHNKFERIASRLPLFRYGNGHMVNNYMVDCENGANMRVGSDLYIEKNYYERDKKPMFGKTGDSPAGMATLVGNKFISCDRLPSIVGKNDDGADASALSSSEEFAVGSWNPSNDYSYSTDNVDDVPAIVNANAGVCKLSQDDIDKYIKDNGKATHVNLVESGNKAMTYVEGNCIVALHAAGCQACVTNVLGTMQRQVAISSDEEVIASALAKGIYVVRIGTNTFKAVIK